MSEIKLLIGADPELFMVDRKGNLVSAYNAIPGTKENPFKVNKGAVQVDGMALEFNIDPAETPQQFISNILAVKEELRVMVAKQGYEIKVIPTAEFGIDYIRAQPREAKELGCTPDYDAYTKSVNPKPDGEVGFRTASGHLHIGWTEDIDPLHPDHFEACCMLAKQLDHSIGVYSLLWDRDTKRRQLYGRPGCFRPKPYGMEYRVLSNAWLNDELVMNWLFKAIKTAFKALQNGNDYEESNMYSRHCVRKYLVENQEVDFNHVKQALRDLMLTDNRLEAKYLPKKEVGKITTDTSKYVKPIDMGLVGLLENQVVRIRDWPAQAEAEQRVVNARNARVRRALEAGVPLNIPLDWDNF